MSKWTEVGNAIKAACLAENAELTGGDLVKAMFSKFDTDGDDKITAEEVLSAATGCSCQITAENAAAMITEADKDDDASLDAFEFETILTTAGVL